MTAARTMTYLMCRLFKVLTGPDKGEIFPRAGIVPSCLVSFQPPPLAVGQVAERRNLQSVQRLGELKHRP